MQVQAWPVCCGAQIASNFFRDTEYEKDADGQYIQEPIPEGEAGYYGPGSLRYKMKPNVTLEEAKKVMIFQLEHSKERTLPHLTVAVISDKQKDELKMAREVGFIEVARWKTSHETGYYLHLLVWGAEQFPAGQVQIGEGEKKPRRKLPTLKQRLTARVRKTAP